jgi:hypothetical protein
MNEKPNGAASAPDSELEARRQFLRKIGKASAMAPAVALLLAANLKTAKAQDQYGGGSSTGGSSTGGSSTGGSGGSGPVG